MCACVCVCVTSWCCWLHWFDWWKWPCCLSGPCDWAAERLMRKVFRKTQRRILLCCVGQSLPTIFPVIVLGDSTLASQQDGPRFDSLTFLWWSIPHHPTMRNMFSILCTLLSLFLIKWAVKHHNKTENLDVIYVHWTFKGPVPELFVYRQWKSECVNDKLLV